MLIELQEDLCSRLSKTELEVILFIHANENSLSEMFIVQIADQTYTSAATDLRAAFTKGVSEVLEAHPETIDPKKYSAKGRDEVRKYVSQKIHVCGSCGKALNFSSCQA